MERKTRKTGGKTPKKAARAKTVKAKAPVRAGATAKNFTLTIPRAMFVGLEKQAKVLGHKSPEAFATSIIRNNLRALNA